MNISSPENPVPETNNNSNHRDDYVKQVTAYVFIIGSMVSFLLAFFPQTAQPAYIPVTIGILAFFFGYILLSQSRKRIGTLPAEDKELLAGKILLRNEEAFERYRVLRGLAGVPGFFRHLGITGLPLATISITLLFCALAIISHLINAFSGLDKTVIPPEFPNGILELSKLTLGAFIGSFVGKVQRESRLSDCPEKASPEKASEHETQSENRSV